ncbi:hypothetical protein DFP72DRAFT_1070364 [Ephemerocybe angulata]|uniref:Uncharacterized protein n=1 Tax=Ephemerocybe angulata TaxID=980116 RepID=A0A8H6M5R8_9AGAR|nr:hypothetical protein DFP72DRAFT_1070364 [Tulosesus angulatus]
MPYGLRERTARKKAPEARSFSTRSRRTPKRSTGAPAPHFTLAVPAGTAGAKRPSSAQPALKRRRTREPDRIADAASIIIVRSGINIEENRFCMLCANGGTLSVCSECNGSAHELTCTSRSRGNTQKLDSSPLCIIAFRLVGSPDAGSAEYVAYQRVYPYFRGNLALVTVWFNLEDDGAQINATVGDLIDTLNGEDFAHVSRFIITITTHSDPGRGDLHHLPEDQGSLTISNLMEFLLPTELREILERGSEKDRNLCVFFTCGAAVKRLGSFEDLRTLGESGTFAEVIGFTQEDLQPELLSPWFSDLVYSFFVLNYKSSEPVLKNHHVTGSHTGIVSFQKDAIYEYAWAHPIRQPFGKPAIAQCPHCRYLDCWKKYPRPSSKPGKGMPLKDGYDLRCTTKDCVGILPCNPPPTKDWKWVGQPLLEGGPHGAWLRFDRTLSEFIPGGAVTPLPLGN